MISKNFLAVALVCLLITSGCSDDEQQSGSVAATTSGADDSGDIQTATEVEEFPITANSDLTSVVATLEELVGPTDDLSGKFKLLAGNFPALNLPARSDLTWAQMRQFPKRSVLSAIFDYEGQDVFSLLKSHAEKDGWNQVSHSSSKRQACYINPTATQITEQLCFEHLNPEDGERVRLNFTSEGKIDVSQHTGWVGEMPFPPGGEHIGSMIQVSSIEQVSGIDLMAALLFEDLTHEQLFSEIKTKTPTKDYADAVDIVERPGGGQQSYLGLTRRGVGPVELSASTPDDSGAIVNISQHLELS